MREYGNPIARINISPIDASKTHELALLMGLRDEHFVRKAIALAEQMGFVSQVEQMGEAAATEEVKVSFRSADYPGTLFFGAADKEDIAYAMDEDRVLPEAIDDEFVDTLQTLVYKGDEAVYATHELLSEALFAMDEKTKQRIYDKSRKIMEARDNAA